MTSRQRRRRGQPLYCPPNQGGVGSIVKEDKEDKQRAAVEEEEEKERLTYAVE